MGEKVGCAVGAAVGALVGAVVGADVVTFRTHVCMSVMLAYASFVTLFVVVSDSGRKDTGISSMR